MAVKSLRQRHGWLVHPEVEEALASVDLPRIRQILQGRRQAEPGWNEVLHGDYLRDSRVQHLAAGGYVFEDLTVYAVLVQLIYPALVKAGQQPRVLDVGCGTGFLTAVLAHLVAPRGGSIVAIDVFSRQVEHAQQTLAICRPDLAPCVSFAVANGWEFSDPAGLPFTAIAVGAQAFEVPEGLVKQIAPGGHLVLPLGRHVPIDSGDADTFQPYWLVEVDGGGKVAYSGRAGPIGVNFLPLLPPADTKQE